MFVYQTLPLLFLISGSGWTNSATTAAASNASVVTFDDSQGFGRSFDGIGGLSGGGATSKLLVNYPDKERNEILDYLFKPNFAASLHILKVEIGGDAQSTDGTEASHMHNSWDENYNRGYEWWLMKEAKARNPNIKLYGLPWGFPGWVGQGTRSPYTNISVTANYIVKWINGAKKFHNLTIDYVGIWNERNYNTDYIKLLRQVLDQRGFKNTQIIAADKKWDISKDVLKDPKLASVVHAIGCHYPGTNSDKESIATGKQLWASEDYSTFNDNVGAGCWARILNQNYVNGYMTSTISWNLIASYYKNLPFYRDGLMTAVEPWSGNYILEAPIWISAHTTQFTSIGWKYLKHGAGVGHFEKGGSYVSLASPDGKHFTIIMETMTHHHSKCIRPGLPKYTVEPQKVTITLKGSYAPIEFLNVYYSKLNFNNTPDILFVKKEPLGFKNGVAHLSLGLDEVYTLTTMTGSKAVYSDPPPSKPFPLPYKDDFETYKLFVEPYYLTPQAGSLEIVQSENASHGQVCRQTLQQPPLKWCPITISFPLAVMGEYEWKDIFVEVDVSIPPVNGTDGVFVAARVDSGGCFAALARGIYFYVFSNKYILANDLAFTDVLSQGSLPYPLSGWHKISLLVEGNSSSLALDGKGLLKIGIPTKPANGFAALGTANFGLADFDNFVITTAKEGKIRMKEYFNKAFSSPLYFVGEKH